MPAPATANERPFGEVVAQHHVGPVRKGSSRRSAGTPGRRTARPARTTTRSRAVPLRPRRRTRALPVTGGRGVVDVLACRGGPLADVVRVVPGACRVERPHPSGRARERPGPDAAGLRVRRSHRRSRQGHVQDELVVPRGGRPRLAVPSARSRPSASRPVGTSSRTRPTRPSVVGTASSTSEDTVGRMTPVMGSTGYSEATRVPAGLSATASPEP